ncbi:hypothetical protein GCM10027055_15840 [Janibacter alkaliphilus]|uniref:F0F1-type ATP synthase assembly protein I n=1 Tax=Janibacter alkaliphilus TaxID=1069963 RepID=A0A852XFV1_9MICO|nr:AtpZ/AtpI family protein [Janibacter alkaliphilus]NYG37425.1 F0F1-type ATP synthase assembly protein I [Janibacter alkaliphilus]
MSRRRQDAAPRLVTKALPDPDHQRAAEARYARDETAPHPAAQADAMGATVLAYLITGPLLFGGLGWLVDQWLGTAFLVALGAVCGMALSLYTIWLRYGTSQAPTPARGESALPGAEPQNEENQ